MTDRDSGSGERHSSLIPRLSSLGGRTLVSAILIPAVGFLFYLDHEAGRDAPWLLGLSLLVALRCVFELTELLGTRSFQPHYPATALCTVGIVASGWAERGAAGDASGPPGLDALGPIGLAYGVAVLLLITIQAVRFREPGRHLEALGAELLIVSYVGLLLSLTVQLRWVSGTEAGYLAIGSLIIAVKFGDIGAYSFGRLFGKRPMAPRLSPAKTWAGAVGALTASGLAGWAWLRWGTPLFDAGWSPCPWYWAVLYGVLIGTAGLIGDLCESLIKRDVGQKDAAALLPGFGGLLDLLDSILYAGPVAFVLWKVLPLATWQ